MRLRLTISILLVIVEVLWLIGVAISATGSPEYEAYVVKESQTLAVIAAEYGVPVTYLAQFNNLKPTDALKAGQVLLVPAQGQSTQGAATLYANSNRGTAATSAGEKVNGVVARVTVASTEIRSLPNAGRVLYKKTPQGTDLLVTGQIETHYAVLMSDGSTGWVPKSAVTLTETRMAVTRPKPISTPASSAANGSGNKLIDTAFEYLGTPYKYGGRLPNNVDCSLLVQTVFARHGKRLPRTAAQQYGVGAQVDVSQLQPADRLYFMNKNGDIIHTGLYIGNGRFIHASSNRGQVAVDDLSNPTYWNKYAGARR
ncbi:MAG: C40 family peptidase [Armatimonadota bacterium]